MINLHDKSLKFTVIKLKLKEIIKVLKSDERIGATLIPVC